MTSVAPGASQHLEITPANTLSNGIISFKGGSPVIQFIIGEQDRLLIGKSVRLCGKFRVKLNDETSANNVVGNANPVAGNRVDSLNLHMPARLGAYSMIDQLVIKSQETHQVIEHIRHYSRFASSFIPITTSLGDQKTHLSQTALSMPSYDAQKHSVVDLPSQFLDGNAFCMSLPCGLFNGTQDIPLASSWGLKGLLVEVHLAPDNNVLFDIAGTSPAPFPNAHYELSDVKLVAEAIQPTAQQLSGYSSGGTTFEYNSISSYFASVNSSNAILNFQLGLSRVLGVFVNFIPSEYINNLSYDGTASGPLVNAGGSVANINQLVFTRGGTRFPLEYNIDTIQKSDPGTDGALVVDSQVMRNFLNSVKSFSGNSRMSASTRNTWVQDSTVVAQTLASLKSPDGGQVFGVGVSYDNISGDGVDFSKENWGLQMDVGLTTNRAHAAYVFVHSKQTLVFSEQGLQVIA